jgi:fatty-acyl-CoA synthase
MAEMSYIHKPAIRPLEHRTIVQLFDIHANKHPDIEAFIFYTSTGQRSTYTFRQIQQMSLSLAASFLRLGWKRGERVALMVPKQVEFVVNYVALLRLGVNVILVPVYGRPDDEVFVHLKRLKCNGYIIHENSVKSFNIRDVLTDLEQVVLIDKERAGISEGEYNYRDLLETGRDLGVDEVLKRQEQVQFDDPALVVFTSGSTGVPKAVQYTHHALANSSIPSFIKDPTASGIEGLRMFNDRPFC